MAALSPNFSRANALIESGERGLASHRQWLRLAERAVYDGAPIPPEPTENLPDLALWKSAFGPERAKLDAASKQSLAPGRVLTDAGAPKELAGGSLGDGDGGSLTEDDDV